MYRLCSPDVEHTLLFLGLFFPKLSQKQYVASFRNLCLSLVIDLSFILWQTTMYPDW